MHILQSPHPTPCNVCSILRQFFQMLNLISLLLHLPRPWINWFSLSIYSNLAHIWKLLSGPYFFFFLQNKQSHFFQETVVYHVTCCHISHNSHHCCCIHLSSLWWVYLSCGFADKTEQFHGWSLSSYAEGNKRCSYVL